MFEADNTCTNILIINKVRKRTIFLIDLKRTTFYDGVHKHTPTPTPILRHQGFKCLSAWAASTLPHADGHGPTHIVSYHAGKFRHDRVPRHLNSWYTYIYLENNLSNIQQCKIHLSIYTLKSRQCSSKWKRAPYL